ncbi:MAG: regulatory iron-sulfur-containing complex subunit RicT [Patescibacteria group bacterium]
MRLAKIKFHKLDKEYYFLPEFKEDDNRQPRVGDQVIVDTSLGLDFGVVCSVVDYLGEPEDLQVANISEVKPLLRLATKADFEQLEKNKINYPKYLSTCHQLAAKHDLAEMKLIEVAESLDGSRLTFYFIANTRVDFRELVKDLVANFHKKIRLQQVGVRDAARAEGDFGPCGLALCCRAWLSQIGNVNPDLIKSQDLMHRGVDRLTGVCGRLKCCLRFEEENYRFAEGQEPKVGEVIKTRLGNAKIIAVYSDRQTVDLEINGEKVEYPYAEAKSCQVVQD